MANILYVRTSLKIVLKRAQTNIFFSSFLKKDEFIEILYFINQTLFLSFLDGIVLSKVPQEKCLVVGWKILLYNIFDYFYIKPNITSFIFIEVQLTSYLGIIISVIYMVDYDNVQITVQKLWTNI